MKKRPKRVTTRMLVRLFKTGFSMRGAGRYYGLPDWEVENRIRDWSRRQEAGR